jgi:hypothetical protein
MFINHYLQFGKLFFAMNERITIWLVSILERKKKLQICSLKAIMVGQELCNLMVLSSAWIRMPHSLLIVSKKWGIVAEEIYLKATISRKIVSTCEWKG